MTTNTVEPAQPTASTVVVAADGSVTVTQVSNATTVTYPGVVDTGFSPINLSPTLWLDASDESTITESGGAVSQWDDKSGNGYNVVQATASRQPTSGTRTLNSLNVLDFDGGDLLVNSYGASLTQPVTYLAVIQQDIANSDDYMFDGVDGANRNAINNNKTFSYRMNAGVIATGGSPDTTVHIFRIVFNSTSSSMHIDGVPTISGNAGTQEVTGTTIGAAYIAAFGLIGLVAEVIIVEGTLTAQQIADTETYLADKWGITL